MTASPSSNSPPSLVSQGWPFAFRLLNRFQPSPENVVLVLAVLIGGSTGMGVVTFHFLIDFIHHLTLENLMGLVAPWGAWTLALVPTLGGLLVGLMRLAYPDFGPSISTLIDATKGSREVSTLRPVTKMVAASVSLGTGASLGPEGPSVEIGANFGMLVGRVLQVSGDRRRLLLGAGAAAGLAAGFNAPIAGVFLALEVVLGTTFATSAVSVLLLAAVVSSLIAQIGLGGQPAFTLPVYEVRSLWELPLYLGLGLLASLVSITYTQSIQLARQLFRGQLPALQWFGKIPRPLQPVLGGACVGLVALLLPQILGIGYETVEAMLQDVEFSVPLLVVLLAAKLGLTAISLGSGLVGGVFAPAMFLGASLGSAYGKIMAWLLVGFGLTQSAIAAPPAYAMVGMAAVLAGSARAPLTAILLLFELTRDYRIVLPLMAAVGLSIWLVERLTPTASKNQNLQQLALNVEKDQKSEILTQMSVAEAMQPVGLVLKASSSILEAGAQLTTARCRCALVLNELEQLQGIVTLHDISRVVPLTPAALEGTPADSTLCSPHQVLSQSLGEICTRELLYAYPDESLAEAVDRMAARGLHQLPVVAREHPQQVLGILDQEEISLACSIAMTRRAIACSLPANFPLTAAPSPSVKEVKELV